MADNIQAALKKKIGPLPTWAWALGIVGAIAVGLYIARRRREAVEGGALSEAEGSTLGTPTTPFAPIVDFPAVEVIPPPAIELPPQEFLLPESIELPFPEIIIPPIELPPIIGEGSNGGRGLTDAQKARIAEINRQIAELKKGGLTQAERKKVKKLRERRKKIKSSGETAARATSARAGRRTTMTTTTEDSTLPVQRTTTPVAIPLVRPMTRAVRPDRARQVITRERREPRARRIARRR